MMILNEKRRRAELAACVFIKQSSASRWYRFRTGPVRF
jgi:hypothetical protein